MADTSRFAETYAALRGLMLESCPDMVAAKDTEGALIVDAPFANPLKPDMPCRFGEVRAGKAYISYHLMPLYMNPRLERLTPPELKKRMQGKTCFNFSRPEPDLFAALGRLTRTCAESYEADLTKAVQAYRAGKGASAKKAR